MTLPAGQISFSQVNVEILQPATATLSLNDSTVRNLAGAPTGQISMSQLQGKTYVRYGTPSGSFSYPGFVYLAISNGMPGDSFQVTVVYNSAGLPGGTIASGNLDGNGNWSNSYNVQGDVYWFPAPRQNWFNFYQRGVYIGQVQLSS